MKILSQNKELIASTEFSSVFIYENSSKVGTVEIVATVGNYPYFSLGTYEAEYAKFIISDIFMAYKRGDTSYEMPVGREVTT